MDGEIIRKLRELRGYKQEYVATKLGITIKAYSKLENGQTKLTTDRLREIAKILGFKPELVINFHEESFFAGIDPIAREPLEETGDHKCRRCGQRIQYLEEEVKFLRCLLNKISGVSP